MKPYNLLCLTTTVALAASSIQAAIVSPYTADADTLHLWHFNEASGTSTADSAGSVGLDAGAGATLGNSGFTGFGNAGSTSAGNDANFLSSTTNAPPVGAGGAFTYEAMINISTISTDVQQIFAMDGDSNSLADRPFHFRIRQGELQFVNIAGASGNDNDNNATIPTLGDDTFVANEWFHVAVTYNGNENTANNLNLYWTRVDASRTEANLIGSFLLVDDLTTANTTAYGVGNDGRTLSGQDKNIEGLIDEVRISGVARAADQMLFAVPEPSSTALLGLGGIALLIRRRR